VTWCAPEKQHWVLQPLIDAGLATEQIRTFLYQLAFDEIVGDGRATIAAVHDVVRDQPARVQAAWTEMVCRLLALPGPDA
jgi:hypothetical protein